MKLHLTLIISIILFLIQVTSPQSQSPNKEYQKILSEIASITPVSSAVIPEGGLTISEDAATFKLLNGEIFRFTTIAGAERILLFKGEGKFIYSPPSQIEKDHLYRFYEKNTLDEDINYLVLMFADTSKLSSVAGLNFNLTTNISPIKNRIQSFVDYTMDTDKGYFDSDFMKCFLNHHTNSLFYAHIGLVKGDPVFFIINPYEREEVNFLKTSESSFIISSNYNEVISSYPLQIQDPNQQIFKEDVIKITDYNITSKIEDNLDFSAKCEIYFDRKFNGTNWIPFSLYSDLRVDSLIINDEKSLKYYRGEENYELWVKLDSILSKGKITVYYNGPLLEKNELGWIALISPDYWFPRYSYRDNVMHELTFTCPENYTIVSIGKKIFEETKDEFTTTRWKSVEPAHSASFNIGSFEKFELADEQNKVNVFISKTGHQLLGSALASYGTLSGADMDEKIATDVLGSIQFYRNMIGPIPLNELQVTEIPYLHGQAFPGLVHLSFLNYQGIKSDMEDELFRAHEVAHQWWGIGVNFDTYHDQWLSEGFAEYSSLWFVQAAFKDNDAFFNVLDKWRDEIFDNRKYLFSTGQQAGPIWLGRRTNTSDTKGDYSLIIYKKGAWVLHMLRNMLIDLKTMKETPFENMIKEFYKTYYGKNASTSDFKRIVDKYFGQSMGWFFNQYVYGTSVPLYRFSYTSEKSPDGNVIVTCKIQQEEVPDDFKMFIPVKIVFSDDRLARLRLEVKGKETIVKLPPLPEEPEEIIFNDLNSVLCKVKYD